MALTPLEGQDQKPTRDTHVDYTHRKILPPAGVCVCVCGQDVGKSASWQTGLYAIWVKMISNQLKTNGQRQSKACRSQSNRNGPKGRALAGAWPKCRLVSRSRTLNRRKISLMPHTAALEGAGEWGSGDKCQQQSSRKWNQSQLSVVPPTHYSCHPKVEWKCRPKLSCCHSRSEMPFNWPARCGWGQERVYPTLEYFFWHFFYQFSLYTHIFY